MKYFVIPLLGSAAQHSLGFSGPLLCLCALDRMFDGIAGKFYVVSSVAHMLRLLVLEQTLLQNVRHGL